MKSISVFVNAVWNQFSLAKEAFKQDPQTQLFLGMMSSDHCLVELFLRHTRKETRACLKTSAVHAVSHVYRKLLADVHVF